MTSVEYEQKKYLLRHALLLSWKQEQYQAECEEYEYQNKRRKDKGEK